MKVALRPCDPVTLCDSCTHAFTAPQEAAHTHVAQPSQSSPIPSYSAESDFPNSQTKVGG